MWTLGWAALPSGARMDARQAAAEAAGLPADGDPPVGARFTAAPAGAIRLGYGLNRCASGGQCRGARHRLLPCAHRRGATAPAVRCCPPRAGSRRYRRARRPDLYPASPPRAAHDQHEHHRRSTWLGSRLRRRSGRSDRLQPAAGAVAGFATGGAGFMREDLFTVVLERFQTDTADHTPTSCLPPPPSSSISTCRL